MPRADPPDLRSFVEQHLIVQGRCYFHCREATSFRQMEVPDRLIGLYRCPAGYVSRIVYYDTEPDSDWFLSWVRSVVAPLTVRERDVRVATRHAWEFDDVQPPQGGLEPYVLRQVYWTQPKPTPGRPQGLYICIGTRETAGCEALFLQPNQGSKPLCPGCLADLTQG